jgi:NhaP-type Na+/H+ or K+/H+ antiporter
MQSFSFGGYLGTPGAIEGVGFWPRAAARLIDTVVHFVVNVCTGLAFGVALGIYADLTSQPAEELVARAEHAGLLSYALALVGFVAYYSIAEAVHGSTALRRPVGAYHRLQTRRSCAALSSRRWTLRARDVPGRTR